MTTKLSTIAASVHAELDIIRGDTVQHRVGAQFITTGSSPPLVVWVRSPKVNHLAGGLHHGPQTLATADADGDPYKEKQIATRRHVVTVHLWESTEELAEDLVLDFMKAIHRRLEGSFQFLGETWPKQDQHEWLARGEPVKLTLSVDTPVPGSRQPTVTVEGQEPDDNQIVDNL
jgi:hypothetical protein